MNKQSKNTIWSNALLQNEGKLKGSASYHLDLLQTKNVYAKLKQEFYAAYNIPSFLEKIK